MNSINTFLPGAGTSGLGAFSGSTPGTNPGEEFEAVMFSTLVRQMRQTASEDGLFPGDKSDTLGGMFDLFMGRQLASSGDLGIGRMVNDWLQQQRPPATEQPDNPAQITKEPGA